MDAGELLSLLEQFHITDRSLQRAIARVKRSPESANLSTLRKETLRYFSCLQREAKRHLADIDRRLDDLYQRQYNLHAERGVAERRLLGASRVLQALVPHVSERGAESAQ